MRQEHTDPEVFQALSSVFTELVVQLIRQRLCLVNQLNLTIEDFSASEKISASQFKIKYALSFEPENNDLNKENLQIAIQRKLTATAAQEKKYQRTLCGPHLDDINFYINDKLAKIYASQGQQRSIDRKSTRLNSSHGSISYAVFCLKKKKFLGTKAYQ